MYAHALRYPSLRTHTARRVRARRLPHAARRRFFLRPTTQHLRVVPRARVERESWLREIARVSIALANVAALSALLYLFF